MLNLFWNSGERRLRAIWRLVGQVIVLVVLDGVFTLAAGIIVTTASLGGDLTGEAGAQQTLAGRLAVSLQSTGWTQAVLAVLMLAATLLSLLFAARLLDRRPYRNFGFHLRKTWWQDFGFGLALGAGLMGLIFVCEYKLKWVKVVGTLQPAILGESFWSGLVQALIVFICVGIYEESISRGYQLKNLAEGLNLALIGPQRALLTAYGISAVIFGLLHATNPNASLTSTLSIMLAGLFLGLGYILTGDLAISIGLHIAWNFFEGNVFGFPVSGTQFGSTFLSIEQSGSQLWTGGRFGPEAGLIGILAIAIGMILTIGWIRLTRRSVRLAHSLADYPRPEKAAN